jgi:hypothetical protein
MVSPKLSFTILIVLATAAGCCGQSKPAVFCGPLATGEKPRYTLQISAPKSSLSAASEVRIKVTATNISDCGILVLEFRPEDLRSGFRLDAHDSQGMLAPLARSTPSALSIKDLPAGSQRATALGPGQSCEAELDISKTYRLDRPGKYTIQVRQLYERPDTWVKSNTITLTVTP